MISTMETTPMKQVRQWRKELGLSQRALGEILGRNRDHIKDIENDRKPITAADYLKIKELLYPGQEVQVQ